MPSIKIDTPCLWCGSKEVTDARLVEQEQRFQKVAGEFEEAMRKRLADIEQYKRTITDLRRQLEEATFTRGSQAALTAERDAARDALNAMRQQPASTPPAAKAPEAPSLADDTSARFQGIEVD